MERRLESAACLLELRDARVPLSSANPLLSALALKSKVRHFVAFNKVDLARSAPLKRIMDSLYKDSNVHSMALRAASLNDCRRLVRNLIDSMSDLQHDSSRPLRIMIAGIPNVGKSTLINGIRAISCGTDVKAARTGRKPGVTRLISEQIKISEDPKVYLWDSPGILLPKIKDAEVGMRLAVTGAILDQQVGEFVIAEYILKRIKESSRLKQLLKVERVPEDLNEFIELYARRMGIMDKGKSLNSLNAVNSFNARFREGSLGKICLDSV
jgi:ribosome biogenesis GTPase A